MHEQKLIIIDSRMETLSTARLRKELTHIDIEHTKIKEVPDVGIMPNVVSMKVPNGCRVNIDHYPKLKIFNGNVFG